MIQKLIVRHSSRTVTAPADGPKSRTEVKTKVSDTEIWALMEGTLTVKEPVRRVSAARVNHCGPIGSIKSL